MSLDPKEKKKLNEINENVIQLKEHVKWQNSKVQKLNKNYHELSDDVDWNKSKIHIGLGAAIGVSAMTTILSALGLI